MSSDQLAVEGVVQFLERLAVANSHGTAIRSPFHSTHLPPMTIRAYCERIVRYSKCTTEAFIVAIMLLCKFSHFTQHPVSSFNVHRLLITSTLIAAKMRDDEYYANTYYAKIGGIGVEELNALELHFLKTLLWDIWIDEDAFESMTSMLTTLASAGAPDSTLHKQLWSSWLRSFEVQTQARHERNSRQTATDLNELSARSSKRTPTSGGSVFPAAPVLANRQVLPGFVQASSQQSVGYASNTSLDGLLQERKPQEQSDSSQNNSGSLGPGGASREQSPNSDNKNQVVASEDTGAAVAKASWATVARSSSGRSSAPVREEIVTSDGIATPCTPTSQSDSSQQVTPTRTMTRQRFNNSNRTTPSSQVRRCTAFVDPTAAVSALRQAPVAQPVTFLATSTAESEVPERRSRTGETKKRPKPEHYQDYR